jgi:hypothetical protein
MKEGKAAVVLGIVRIGNQRELSRYPAIPAGMLGVSEFGILAVMVAENGCPTMKSVSVVSVMKISASAPLSGLVKSYGRIIRSLACTGGGGAKISFLKYG